MRGSLPLVDFFRSRIITHIIPILCPVVLTSFPSLGPNIIGGRSNILNSWKLKKEKTGQSRIHLELFFSRTREPFGFCFTMIATISAYFNLELSISKSSLPEFSLWYKYFKTSSITVFSFVFKLVTTVRVTLELTVPAWKSKGKNFTIFQPIL